MARQSIRNHRKALEAISSPRGPLPKHRRPRAVRMADFRRFVDWAVERAEEEEPRVSGGAQSFLRALIDDGKKLLGDR